MNTSVYRRIIAPVDDSLAAQAGVRAAITLAKNQGAQLKFFSVLDEAGGDYGGGELGWIAGERLGERLSTEAERLLAEAAQLAENAGLVVEIELVEAPEGHVARMIRQVAAQWDADLLVIGTHGRHGLVHMLHGSTAETVAHAPDLPTLVVPVKHPEDNAT